MTLLSLFRKSKIPTSLAILLSTSATLLSLSAEAASAQSSSRSGTRVLTAQDDAASATNGGAMSRRDVKASHVAPSANSGPTAADLAVMLTDYRTDQEAIVAAELAHHLATEDYKRLDAFSDADILAAYPEGGFEDAVVAATEAFAQTRIQLNDAKSSAEVSLSVLIGGGTLSEDSISKLHAILGL